MKLCPDIRKQILITWVSFTAVDANFTACTHLTRRKSQRPFVELCLANIVGNDWHCSLQQNSGWSFCKWLSLNQVVYEPKNNERVSVVPQPVTNTLFNVVFCSWKVVGRQIGLTLSVEHWQLFMDIYSLNTLRVYTIPVVKFAGLANLSRAMSFEYLL